MGQKVNPNGLRVGVIKNWDSRWFAKDSEFGDLLVEDYKIRKYIKKKLFDAGVPAVEIERTSKDVKIMIQCARPGLVIGKGGEDITKLEKEMAKMTGKPTKVSIIEIKNPDTNATLVAENIAAQLEKRIGFRRAMKQSMGRAMRMGAKGIKTCCSGRLGGAEIARTEHYHEGTIPLQTLRADIDYGFAEANTTYGRIGVKVWIYKGEVLTGGPRLGRSIEAPKPASERRRDRRDGDRRGRFGGRDNRGGGDRRQFGDRRPSGDRRQFGDRRPAGDQRPAGGQRPTGGPRPAGDQRPAGDRRPPAARQEGGNQ